MDNQHNSSGRSNPKGNASIFERTLSLFKLAVIITAFAVIVFLLALSFKFMTGASRVLLDAMDTPKKITEFLSAKEKFSAALGPIVSQERYRRLQFFQRNQVCLFRIIRYRGRDLANHNYVEFYKKESDKTPVSSLPVFLNQYCEWQAKGVFEFSFYVDMSDLSKWDYKWDPKHFRLTIYAPDISANTPAELEPIVFTKLADSLTINEGFTKNHLEKLITTKLKNALAEEQKRFFYEEARLAVKDTYLQFLRMIPGLKLNRIPEIEVVFPHERQGNSNEPISRL